MGKGDKTRSRARKLAKAHGLPELTAIPPRQPNGQHRHRADAPRDPQKTALGARCRLFGIPDTKENRKSLTGGHIGSQLGMVIETRCRHPQDIRRLWSVWHGFGSAMRTYRLRIIGQSGTAKGAAIAMVPEPVETDQGATIDTRTTDERDRDAVNAYMAWHGKLAHLPAATRTLLHDAERERGADLWRDHKPTPRGLATFAALQSLADVVDGGKG